MYEYPDSMTADDRRVILCGHFSSQQFEFHMDIVNVFNSIAKKTKECGSDIPPSRKRQLEAEIERQRASFEDMQTLHFVAQQEALAEHKAGR